MVIPVILLATSLSLIDRNIGHFFGLGISLTILWSSNYRWAELGFGSNCRDISKRRKWSYLAR